MSVFILQWYTPSLFCESINDNEYIPKYFYVEIFLFDISIKSILHISSMLSYVFFSLGSFAWVVCYRFQRWRFENYPASFSLMNWYDLINCNQYSRKRNFLSFCRISFFIKTVWLFFQVTASWNSPFWDLSNETIGLTLFKCILLQLISGLIWHSIHRLQTSKSVPHNSSVAVIFTLLFRAL